MPARTPENPLPEGLGLTDKAIRFLSPRYDIQPGEPRAKDLKDFLTDPEDGSEIIFEAVRGIISDSVRIVKHRLTPNGRERAITQNTDATSS